MEFLASELDDADAARCGRCANCAGPVVSATFDQRLMQEALTFLKRGHRPIEPRKQWPAGIPTRRGNIPPVNRLIEGRALSVYNDAGWGRLVS
jgi:ATP-dependent DNA helicase RecQ